MNFILARSRLRLLQALYKFLDVMSVFDWERHCVSMTGRVLLASFPNYEGADPISSDRHWRSNSGCLQLIACLWLKLEVSTRNRDDAANS